MIAKHARPLILASVLLSAAALTGCGLQSETPTPSSTQGPTLSPSAPSTPSPTPDPAPDPTASATPEPTGQPGTPIARACTDVLSLQAVYDFNPNFGTDPAFSPAAGSEAAAAVARGGFACGWVNQTSGSTFHLAVSHPSDREQDALEDAAEARGTEFDLDDADGWFAVVDGLGTAWIEVDDLWVVLTGADFGAPADLAGLAQAAVDALDS